MNKMIRLLSLVVLAIVLGLPSAQASEQEQAAQETSLETAELETQATYERGLRLYRSRSFREALTTFTEVAQVEQDRADVHYLIGYCHLMLKEYQPSLDAFHRSFEIDPEFDPRTIYQK